MANYLAKRGANVAPSYASTGDLPASTQAGDLVFVGGQLGIAVDASTFNTCDKTDIVSVFGGTVKGFVWGGQNRLDKVESVSFTSDGNAASLADANVDRLYNCSDCYRDGGILYLTGGAPDSTASNFTGSAVHRKYTISSSAEAALSYSVTRGRSGPSCGRDVPGTKQFTYGGNNFGPTKRDDIDKLTYASEAISLLTSTILVESGAHANLTSSTKDYLGGGDDNSAYVNTIQAFTHASEGNTADIANLINTIKQGGGVNSDSVGYIYGGFGSDGGYGARNNIQSFTFASEANATDVADLIAAGRGAGQLSSETHGYLAGGYESANTDRIQKIVFASIANATDIGDLNTAGGNGHVSRGAQ